MGIEKTEFEPTYTKENGVWVVNIDKMGEDLPFVVIERNMVYLPPGGIGGNHKHPRIEAFVGFGETLTLLWTDERGVEQMEMMNKDGRLSLFIIPSYTSHAVLNKGTRSGFLLEFASDSQHDIEKVELV